MRAQGRILSCFERWALVSSPLFRSKVTSAAVYNTRRMRARAQWFLPGHLGTLGKLNPCSICHGPGFPGSSLCDVSGRQPGGAAGDRMGTGEGGGWGNAGTTKPWLQQLPEPAGLCVRLAPRCCPHWVAAGTCNPSPSDGGCLKEGTQRPASDGTWHIGTASNPRPRCVGAIPTAVSHRLLFPPLP